MNGPLVVRARWCSGRCPVFLGVVSLRSWVSRAKERSLRRLFNGAAKEHRTPPLRLISASAAGCAVFATADFGGQAFWQSVIAWPTGGQSKYRASEPASVGAAKGKDDTRS